MEQKLVIAKDEQWYQEFHHNLMERAMKDETFCRDKKDAEELEALVGQLELSEYQRRLVEDYIACLLAQSERCMELAYEIGKEEHK